MDWPQDNAIPRLDDIEFAILRWQLAYVAQAFLPVRWRAHELRQCPPESYTSAMTHATREGTAAYRDRFPTPAAAGHFRRQQGVWLSSLGIGTYLGNPDEATDQAYTAAVIRAVELGANVIDTAINYRLQRSERSIGAALAALAAQGRFRREELVICTKAGFLTPDGEIPANARRYFEENYFSAGIIGPDDVVAGVHCMAPRFLADQIGRSLRNMGLAATDVFYLHNPETQLSAVPRQEFLRRLRLAFEHLEKEVAEGRIQWYGTATWSGYRQASHARDYLSLGDLAAIAREVAGDRHHFRFVQLPFNLAMPEAIATRNQTVAGREANLLAANLLDAARDLGITVVASASLMQASLAAGLPGAIGEALGGLRTDAQRALQFARSAPGVSVALVGMKDSRHVEENLALAAIAPAPEEQFMKIFHS